MLAEYNDNALTAHVLHVHFPFSKYKSPLPLVLSLSVVLTCPQVQQEGSEAAQGSFGQHVDVAPLLLP
jgi:hypothetical protein